MSERTLIKKDQLKNPHEIAEIVISTYQRPTQDEGHVYIEIELGLSLLGIYTPARMMHLGIEGDENQKQPIPIDHTQEIGTVWHDAVVEVSQKEESQMRLVLLGCLVGL